MGTLYFIPNITKITRLETTGDKFEWETETDRGYRKFTTRGRRSTVFIENKMVIVDIYENLYQVENLEDFDEKSINIIQSTF